MKQKPDTIRCQCCKGAGRIPLTGVYADTLTAVRRWFVLTQTPIVANRDAEWFECKPTALNNRLSKLEEYGFLRSELYGRQRRFFLKSSSK